MIEVIWQNLHHDFAAQFTVRLFLGATGCDVAFLFRGKSGDLLNRFFKASDFKVGRGISNQLAVRGGALRIGRRVFLWRGVRPLFSQYLCVVNRDWKRGL